VADKRFRTGAVLTVAFAHLVHDTYSAFLPPILPLLIGKLGISYSLAGFLFMAQRMPSLFNPLVGVAADRFGARYFIIAAPAVTAVVMSLLGVAPSYPLLLSMLLVMGFSSALFHTPGPVLVRRLSGDSIGRGMSVFMLGGELARTLGPLTILGAVSLWGLQGTWRLIPFGLLASAVVYIQCGSIRISDDVRKSADFGSMRRTFVRFLPAFAVIGGITFFRAFMVAALTFFLPTYLTVQGESIAVAGISLSILQFAGAAGTLCCGTLSDRIGRRGMLMFISVATPSFMWLFLVAKGSLLAVPLLVVIGFTLFATSPVLLAFVHDIDSDHPSFVNGIYITITFMISSVVVVMVGKMGDVLGLDATYRISAILAFGALPFVRLIKKGRGNHDGADRAPVDEADAV